VASQSNPFVFVYGTLMRGQINHELLAGAELIGEGVTCRAFGFYAGPDRGADADELPQIPYAYEQPASGDAVVQVQGEVWAVDADILMALDQLEGHPDWYQRKSVRVLISEKDIETFMYIIPGKAPEGLRPLVAGRF
jgi:gamma-glutamylcyclotransferase (GGCT)/AIG2-like uncharacterized protein YtfP